MKILTAIPSAKFEIIKTTVEQDSNTMNVNTLCEIAGVSRPGYYKWLRSADKRAARERRDEADFSLVLEAFKYRGYDKGVRGIHMRLLHQTPPVIMNTKKVSRLMKKYNLRCPVRKANPYRKRGLELQAARTAPNLLNREFRAHSERAVLLTDITYIPRYGTGKYSYLCVIMDAYTKEILTYTMSYTPDTDLVLKAVMLLMEKYGDELRTDALIHSDQGCQYTSHRFAELIQNIHLRQSMSHKATCWDNAPQESLFGHMKDDIRFRPCDIHADITRKVDDWIDYYNNDRPQWSLAKLTPSEYYIYVTTGQYPLSTTPGI